MWMRMGGSVYFKVDSRGVDDVKIEFEFFS
jgi:hypothetical protein